MGVDIGTYSSKGVLVNDTDGAVSAEHVIEHDLSMPKSGWVEHDADTIWWGEFAAISRDLIEKSGISGSDIRGVGVSGIGNCVLPIDEDGNALRPGILYGIDTRASDEIKELEKTLGRESIYKISATHLSSSAAGPKIFWIKRHEPEIFAKARWFLNSHSYVIYKLTGKATVDIYTAGGYAPLIDMAQRKWHPPASDLVVPIEKLPKILPSCAIAGRVTKAAAQMTGLAEGTPVVTGAIDAGAEAIGAGVQHSGDMMIMLGSSNSLILITDKLKHTQNFWGLNWIQPGQYAVVGGMSTVGSLTRWFRDHFSPLELSLQAQNGIDAYTSLTKLLDNSPPGANGLVALPYFEGERTPFYDPDAKGILAGLNLKHTRADVYRALLESVGYGIRHNLESMAEEGLTPQRFIVIGGGTRNIEWLQIISDIAGISLQVPEKQIGAAYGDAIMAAVGTGILEDLRHSTKWITFAKQVTPRSAYTAHYDALYNIYRDLYKYTAPLMRDLSKIQHTGDGK
jgi:xylulokinase